MSSNLLRVAIRFLSGLALGVCAFVVVPTYAERIAAPLDLLYAAGNRLVSALLVEINPEGRLVFERADVLGGAAAPGKIDVRVPLSVVSTAKLGERYIFGYSTTRPDPRHPTRIVSNPQGPTLLTSTGLEPALFRDTPQARAILHAGSSERGRESQALFDLLINALAGRDAALQNLAAGELMLDPEFAEHLRKSDQAKIEKVARDAHTPADVRGSLLQAAANRPLQLGNWWQEAATEMVVAGPADVYAAGTSDRGGLVLVALELLDRQAVTLPTDVLTRWVLSDNPSLVERACLMLRRQSPAAERSAIDKALADRALPENTRVFLKDHLRRLDLLNAKSKAGKDGTG